MKTKAKKIVEHRKLKGLTQEELAVKAKVNLRTIQRIEKSESEPRGKTLNLIYTALDLNPEEFLIDDDNVQSKWVSKIINYLFLLILNCLLMLVFGYLTIVSNAQSNSMYGAYLLSFFLPFFIVFFTQKMSSVERILKFGSGFIIYFFLILFTHGFPKGFVSGLYPSLLICITVLFFGNDLLKKVAEQ
ncbi:MAG: helix-turn-helix transcriptional regulator [Nonlabens sp.]